MKDRILNNWKTTALGFTLLILAVILLFMRIITLGEFSAFLPTILGLIYVRDTFLKLTSKP
ncbi:MAG: hypothetical protein WCI71_17590 [Bacteroidota bacterium]